jgi:xanthine dehydrogenase accessory factor
VTRDDLARRADDLISHRVPFTQALVVRAQRPTSVRPGDAAIVLGDGSIEGFVGGACAESTVRTHGLEVLETGMPLLLRILPAPSPDEAEQGEAERGAPGPHGTEHHATEHHATEHHGTEHDAPKHEGAVTVRNPCLSGGALEIFLEPHVPPPRITVVGQTPIAHALADLGGRLGYEVEPSADGDIAPGPHDAAVVVASHGRDEERALTRALRQGVPYVALVASRRRGAAVAASLDLEPDLLARLHTPAGLDIGARTAAEIALSILAEIMSLRPRQAARDRPAPSEAVAPAAAAAPAPTAIDPICGMTVVAAVPTLYLDHDGGRVWFCGEGCRRAFAGGVERKA